MASVQCADLTDKIRQEARRLGFMKAGITPVGTLPYCEHFSEWLSKGMHGDMHYLERQASRRLNPALILPNARSIVVLALNYYTMMSNGKDPLKGMISRYAWGDDYHDALRFRLKELLHFIQCQEPSIQGRCYVDTGPVMEKVWGGATCLGWMGKNTNLITRDHGSWFFLGVILLDTVLEPDSREKDFCGQCNRCIKACPTGAIVTPLCPGCPAVRFLPDYRAPWAHSSPPAYTDRESNLWLRRLPGSLPMEPFRCKHD